MSSDVPVPGPCGEPESADEKAEATGLLGPDFRRFFVQTP
jgi:hypothetical protein